MTLSTIDADYLRGVVMRTSGNHVDPARDYLFESRLQRVLRYSAQHFSTQPRSNGAQVDSRSSFYPHGRAASNLPAIPT